MGICPKCHGIRNETSNEMAFGAFLGEKMRLFRAILVLLAFIGSIQSAILIRGNQNLGNGLIYLFTLGCWVYAVLFDRVNELCKKGPWKWFRWAILAGVLVVVSLAVFVGVYGSRTTARGDEKALIVLGAGLNGEWPTAMLARRLDAAYEYWKEHPQVMIVLSGGQGPDEVIPEAQAMENYMLQKGVPKSNLLQESRSTDTWENLSFSRTILQEQGIDTGDFMAFVTSDFHCWRAAWTAKQLGYEQMRHIPSPTPPSRVLPSWLREGIGVIYYLVLRKSI